MWELRTSTLSDKGPFCSIEERQATTPSVRLKIEVVGTLGVC
jgi:hypothetical protein